MEDRFARRGRRAGLTIVEGERVVLILHHHADLGQCGLVPRDRFEPAPATVPGLLHHPFRRVQAFQSMVADQMDGNPIQARTQICEGSSGDDGGRRRFRHRPQRIAQGVGEPRRVAILNDPGQGPVEIKGEENSLFRGYAIQQSLPRSCERTQHGHV